MPRRTYLRRVGPLVPLDRLRQALFEGRFGDEAELVAGAGDVEAAAGPAVGFRRVPDDRAFEPRELGDEMREVLHRHLAAGAEVDRLGAVVAEHRGEDALGAVVDVQELAAGRARAPGDDLAVAAPARFDALAHQRG